MRRTWLGTHALFVAALMALAGCHNTPDKYKPGPRVEEYTVPPAADARFSQPVSYPEKTLNTDNPRKGSAGSDTPPPSMRGPGGGGQGGFRPQQ